MRILLDTKVVLRLGDRGQATHPEALAAVEWLDANGHECVIVPQVLYEYWVVATRPRENNGLGIAVADAQAAISQWTGIFRLMLDERGVFGYWRNLVASNDVKGKSAHDARLVAAMQRHGLTDLLSFNKPDFVRFGAINVLTPADVLKGQVAPR
jgi:predicted nucleic acid-binding protein